MKGKSLYPVNFEVNVVISAQSSVPRFHLCQLLAHQGGGGDQGGDKVAMVIVCPLSQGDLSYWNLSPFALISRPFPVSPASVYPLYAECALMPADI